jgi:spermidine/putrescine transport system ATP-binding protein
MISGIITFILYKGNHYHLTILTNSNENIYADSNDVWDDGDRVGISIMPEAIKIENP